MLAPPARTVLGFDVCRISSIVYFMEGAENITTGCKGALSALNDQSSMLVGLWTKSRCSPILRPFVPCCLAVVVEGCVLLGPPREVIQPPGVDIERNITFATVNGRDLKLDLYTPHGVRGPLPLVIWVHGGGWFRGSRSPCPIAPLATRGYVVAAVDYRHSGIAPFPAQVHDVKSAVRWIRQNPEFCHADPERIGAWGGIRRRHTCLPAWPCCRKSSTVWCGQHNALGHGRELRGCPLPTDRPGTPIHAGVSGELGDAILGAAVIGRS